MTDKQIIIKEITECGFYCSKDDVEHLYIYEVIKNTDEEWLKENPEATLLIDEWIYDYTDYDDRKVYCTSGNLIAVCNDSANCKVYKIEDTKYKIYGNCGQFLIEDKPTYKEQLKAKEQECKELRVERKNLKRDLEGNIQVKNHAMEEIKVLKEECKVLKDKLLKWLSKEGLRQSEKEFYEEQLDLFRADNKELKAEMESLRNDFEKNNVMAASMIQALQKEKTDSTNMFLDKIGQLNTENYKLKQTLAEIKPILELYANSKIGEEQPDGTYKLSGGIWDGLGICTTTYDPRPAREGLKKISEVEDDIE